MAIAVVEGLSWDHGLAPPTQIIPRPAMVDLRKRQSAIDPHVSLVWSSSSLNSYILSSIVISHLNNHTNSLRVSLADVLLTPLPGSVREMAATNIPTVSKIFCSEFPDGSKPA